ncbi:MAG: hydroxymyristoyl-ACP dehydratase [Treponema sp.]|nr:hydroxymyristoyl-ACP dehydratase [Treponema sp.]
MKEANNHDIVNEKILSQEENKIALEFVIPATSDFFDGHFPEYKLLPAVAQFEVITRFSRKYLGSQRYVPNIKRIKFSAPIRPDTKIHLDLSKNITKGTIAFTMADANVEGKVYSSGSFNFLAE